MDTGADGRDIQWAEQEIEDLHRLCDDKTRQQQQKKHLDNNTNSKNGSIQQPTVASMRNNGPSATSRKQQQQQQQHEKENTKRQTILHLTTLDSEEIEEDEEAFNRRKLVESNNAQQQQQQQRRRRGEIVTPDMETTTDSVAVENSSGLSSVPFNSSLVARLQRLQPEVNRIAASAVLDIDRNGSDGHIRVCLIRIQDMLKRHQELMESVRGGAIMNRNQWQGQQEHSVVNEVDSSSSSSHWGQQREQLDSGAAGRTKNGVTFGDQSDVEIGCNHGCDHDDDTIVNDVADEGGDTTTATTNGQVVVVLEVGEKKNPIIIEEDLVDSNDDEVNKSKTARSLDKDSTTNGQHIKQDEHPKQLRSREAVVQSAPRDNGAKASRGDSRKNKKTGSSTGGDSLNADNGQEPTDAIVHRTRSRIAGEGGSKSASHRKSKKKEKAATSTKDKSTITASASVPAPQQSASRTSSKAKGGFLEEKTREVRTSNRIRGKPVESKKTTTPAVAAAAAAATVSNCSETLDDGECDRGADNDQEIHPPMPLVFENSGMVREQHKQSIYCMAWSADVYTTQTASSALSSSALQEAPSFSYRYLATCAGRHVTVYEIQVGGRTDNNRPFTLKQSYVDSYRKEIFYSCVFAGRVVHPDTALPPPSHYTTAPPRKKARRETHQANTAPQLLCVGGVGKCIKAIDPVRQVVTMTLRGHSDQILDLKISPVDEWIILSSSKDESFRLWSLEVGTTLAMFSGYGGHHDQVISVAWHSSGDRIASAGMDNTIKIWNVGKNVKKAIATSHKNAEAFRTFGERRYVPPEHEQFPIFSTRKIHTQCVDCVQFVGNLLLSKSSENTVVLWYPKIGSTTANANSSAAAAAAATSTPMVQIPPPDDVIALRTFQFQFADVWYLRFAVDPSCQVLAVGNMKGTVYAWNIGGKFDDPPTKLATKSGSTIRWVSFAPDNKMLVASTDSGTVYKWDISWLKGKS